jgi:hypothetical protein
MPITACFLVACSGSYNATLTPGYTYRVSGIVAVMRIDYPDPAAADSVTNVLEEHLSTCDRVRLIPARSVDSLLHLHEVTIPRAFTIPYLRELYEITGANYLLTGTITFWKRSNFGIASRTSNVGLVLSLYDLFNGKTVWVVSGEDESKLPGIFAERPEWICRQVIRKMLNETEGFCRD